MPAILTHYVANKVAYNTCENSEIKKIISENMIPYMAAAQGTDNFYFYHEWKLMECWRTKVYGWGVHHFRPRQYLLFMADYTKANYSDSLLAYTLGYICHHCLDKIVHKLVIEDAPRLDPHTLLENELDVMYAIKEGFDPFEIDRSAYFMESSYDPGYEIGKMHKWLLENVYRFIVKCDEKAYSDSYKHWSGAFKNAYKPTPEMMDKIHEQTANRKYNMDYFVYLKPDEMTVTYDWDKYYRAIDSAIKQTHEYMYVIFSYIVHDGDRQKIIDTVDNINLRGNPVKPLEKRFPFLKPLIKKSGLDPII